MVRPKEACPKMQSAQVEQLARRQAAGCLGQYEAIQGNTKRTKQIQGNTRQYKTNTSEYKGIQGSTREYKAVQSAPAYPPTASPTGCVCVCPMPTPCWNTRQHKPNTKQHKAVQSKGNKVQRSTEKYKTNTKQYKGIQGSTRRYKAAQRGPQVKNCNTSLGMAGNGDSKLQGTPRHILP